MDKKDVGKLIKDRRKEQNITQEELCDGICTASTLSRIESGKFNSNTGVLTRLLERLGLSADFLREATYDEDYIVRQKIRDINHLNICGNREKAHSMLDELGKDYETFSIENKQRYDVIETKIMYEDGLISAETQLDHLEDTLRLTIPNYHESELPKYMTNMEAQILRDIANSYGLMEDYEPAIDILMHIKSNIERHAVDKDFSSKKLISICYSLSKYLGLVGRYDESIQAARDGMSYCEYVGDSRMLPSCMYNCAWSLSRRNYYGDKEEAKKLANEALSLCTSRAWNSEELNECINRLLEQIDS